MTHDHEDRHQANRHSSRGKWVLVGFLAIGAFFLLTEHRAHLFGALPFLLLLACPLMHLFHGHGGHSGHGGHNGSHAPGARNTPDGKDISHAHEHGGKQS